MLLRMGMVSPIDAAWALLKQQGAGGWGEVSNWGDGDIHLSPQVEQGLKPWPEGTSTGWHYDDQGNPLSAEDAMRHKEQLKRTAELRRQAMQQQQQQQLQQQLQRPPSGHVGV